MKTLQQFKAHYFRWFVLLQLAMLICLFIVPQAVNEGIRKQRGLPELELIQFIITVMSAVYCTLSLISWERFSRPYAFLLPVSKYMQYGYYKIVFAAALILPSLFSWSLSLEYTGVALLLVAIALIIDAIDRFLLISGPIVMFAQFRVGYLGLWLVVLLFSNPIIEYGMGYPVAVAVFSAMVTFLLPVFVSGKAYAVWRSNYEPFRKGCLIFTKTKRCNFFLGVKEAKGKNVESFEGSEESAWVQFVNMTKVIYASNSFPAVLFKAWFMLFLVMAGGIAGMSSVYTEDFSIVKGVLRIVEDPLFHLLPVLCIIFSTWALGSWFNRGSLIRVSRSEMASATLRFASLTVLVASLAYLLAAMLWISIAQALSSDLNSAALMFKAFIASASILICSPLVMILAWQHNPHRSQGKGIAMYIGCIVFAALIGTSVNLVWSKVTSGYELNLMLIFVNIGIAVGASLLGRQLLKMSFARNLKNVDLVA